MATYTVLRNSEKRNRSDVVIEFPVPSGDNSAIPDAVAWTAIVAEVRAVEQATPDATATVNPRKQGHTAYLASLDAGQIVEVPLSVEYDANLTNGEKVTILDAAVDAKVTEFTSEFAALYEFYGYIGGG